MPAAAAPPQPRIIGGTEATTLDWPFMTALVLGNDAFCGGSLVAPTWVLTAAHCFFGSLGGQVVFPADVDVVLGVLDIGGLPALPPGAERIGVAEILVHPNFIPNSDFASDLALLRLAAPSSFTPVALAASFDTARWAPGAPATVKGWGSVIPHPPPPPPPPVLPSDTLRQVQVPVVADDLCHASASGPIIADIMLCAGNLAVGGVDSCLGDSGGPLAIPDGDGTWTQIGIVSFGAGCGQPNSPGVNTEVAAFRSWMARAAPVLNGAPVALADGPLVVAPGGTLSRIAAGGVLANDVDPEDQPLTAALLTAPAHGTITLFPDGSFTYVHRGSGPPADTFSYTASDGLATSAPATVSILVGTPAHTVGQVDPGQGRWSLTDSSGAARSFFFGNPGDVPFVGDWDCDGDETPGMYRPSDGFVYLANANRSQIADIQFFFGDPGDVPLAGDFNGDGCDTVSLYRPGEGRFHIINQLGKNGGGLGAAEFAYTFGDIGDQPFVGDFDGDGVETAGLHRLATGLVYFRQSHSAGFADAQFTFGNPGDRLVAGDWGIVDGVFSPAVFRPADTTFHLKHANGAGPADEFLSFGTPASVPVAGNFGLG